MRQLKITHQITNRDSNTIEKYFNDISKESMITPDEEVELARRIKLGDHVALEKMVRANLRFVVSVAKQYHNGSMPLNDLINEGNLGLIKAAQQFDATKGFKFISYAVWWIRQSIMKALDEHSRLVRIPANKRADLYKINKAAALIEQQYEREPTAEELADFLGVKEEDIHKIGTAAIRQSSLDAPFGNDNEGSLLDVLENADAESADSALVNGDSLRAELGRILAQLSEREQLILMKLYGIGMDYSMSMEDIAEELGLTRERVRQIKEKALTKMRAVSNTNLLNAFA
ncbi:sigma-70 family RNA polymerase sigma factor [Cesiribacter andamanensis]|uniref:RNA polymerase sigma factor rpoD n=1 Tax=Cesiribacter andamanensis AMV16 TaxID=1279009 RepID=M7NJT1_9BACT|nr:RNA polymerase sigma factor RpoD/SigA [Cesiribacter andamanensis]EMR02055.1 RNA polymerase sigma factor rpoD [Cesiribacter andamanensis AMV16]